MCKKRPDGAEVLDTCKFVLIMFMAVILGSILNELICWQRVKNKIGFGSMIWVCWRHIKDITFVVTV